MMKGLKFKSQWKQIIISLTNILNCQKKKNFKFLRKRKGSKNIFIDCIWTTLEKNNIFMIGSPKKYQGMKIIYSLLSLTLFFLIFLEPNITLRCICSIKKIHILTLFCEEMYRLSKHLRENIKGRE